MFRVYFPINLRKVREVWKRSAGVNQDGFAGYTRTMMQTYESYRVDAPFDLVLWVSENTGISCHDLLTREILIDEIPTGPLVDTMPNNTVEAMKSRKKDRIRRLSTVSED